MDVAQIAKDSDQMMAIIKNAQAVKNNTANKLITMAIAEKTGALNGKSNISGAIVDITS